MLFMNEWDIEQAARDVFRVRDDASRKVLADAVQLLYDLKELTNQVSDGWAYWPKPCRAAKKLQELIQAGIPSPRNFDPPAVTVADLKKAVAPIKTFLTKNRKDNWPTITLPC